MRNHPPTKAQRKVVGEIKKNSEKEIDLHKSTIPPLPTAKKKQYHNYPANERHYGTQKKLSIKTITHDPQTGANTGNAWRMAQSGLIMAPDGSATSSHNPNPSDRSNAKKTELDKGEFENILSPKISSKINGWGAFHGMYSLAGNNLLYFPSEECKDPKKCTFGAHHFKSNGKVMHYDMAKFQSIPSKGHPYNAIKNHHKKIMNEMNQSPDWRPDQMIPEDYSGI